MGLEMKGLGTVPSGLTRNLSQPAHNKQPTVPKLVVSNNGLNDQEKFDFFTCQNCDSEVN